VGPFVFPYIFGRRSSGSSSLGVRQFDKCLCALDYGIIVGPNVEINKVRQILFHGQILCIVFAALIFLIYSQIRVFHFRIWPITIQRLNVAVHEAIL
jgi:hypothetical protein